MKTIRTNELTGAALDWAVAKCENFDTRNNYRVWVTLENEQVEFDCCADDWEHAYEQAQEAYPDGKIAATDELSKYTPSTDWAQGGPIIERERISTAYEPSMIYDDTCRWKAISAISDNEHFYGPTLMIAAMRCYVASKLGDEIEIPEELG